MMMRSRSSRLLLALSALVLLVGLIAAGLYRVAPGEVALVRAGDGSLATVRGEGWGWKQPFVGEVRRLPRTPISLADQVEVTTAEGAAIVLAVTGRFGVAVGGERAWSEAAGWVPFVDGLRDLIERAAAPAVRATDPADLFLPAAGAQLAAAIAGGLAAAGVAAEGLVVEVPVERNPVAAAVLRNRMKALARPSGKKVLLVGWDGADWLMIRPLLAAGKLPNLAGLIRRGMAGELRSQLPLLSPLVWTTIATGKPVEEHGIADFLVQDTASGGLVPISSSSRKVHALWTILPYFGLTTDVVAWWATWPAERIDGTMVTDRVAYQLFDVQVDAGGEGKVYPPEAWEEVKKGLVPAEEVSYQDVHRFVDVSREDFERRWASLPPERRQEDRVNHLRKILATTKSYQRIALSLLDHQTDLTMVYYEGTDTVGHLFARFLPPVLPGIGADDVRRFGAALPAFYDYADELLGELLEKVDDDTVVVLVSDHGFFTGEARPAADPADFTTGAPEWHRLYGVIVAAGPGIRPGKVEGATVLDVTPTVLALLGLPVPQDMPGRALAALVPAGGAARPPAQLASFEVLPRAERDASVRVASKEDEERLRELVALGYISPTALEGRGAAGAAAQPAPPAPAAPGAPGAPAAQTPAGTAAAGGGGGGLQAVSTEAYNLGRIYQRQGKFDEARAQFRVSVERSPTFGLGYASLAQVEAQLGNHSRSFELLVEGFGKSGDMPMSAVTGLVDEASRCGRLADAERVLARIRSGYEGQHAYHAALGLLYEKTDRTEEALAQYRRSLEIDPLDQYATGQTVAVLRRLGREREAREFLEAAFRRAAGQVTAMNQLAVIALQQGWADQAETLLRRVLASDPGNPGVLANLGAALAQQGKRGEALSVLKQSVERDPTNARNFFNLGALLADQGEWAEALAAFDKAGKLGLRSAKVHTAAAKMHFRLGDPGRARLELQEALAIEPADPEARQLLAVLDQGAG